VTDTKSGYLLAKILLAAAEGINNGRKLRIICLQKIIPPDGFYIH
jgi:hypothetical protein